MLGQSSVGKSAVIQRFIQSSFDANKYVDLSICRKLLVLIFWSRMSTTRELCTDCNCGIRLGRRNLKVQFRTIFVTRIVLFLFMMWPGGRPSLGWIFGWNCSGSATRGMPSAFLLATRSILGSRGRSVRRRGSIKRPNVV